MTISKLLLPSLAALVSLSACVPTDGSGVVADGVSAVEIDKGFASSGGGSWNTGRDTYEFVFTVRNVNGKAALCGVLDDDTSGLTTQMNQRLRDFYVLADGTVVARGFEHFTRVDDSRARGLVATCKVGEADWRPAFQTNKNWELKSRGDGRYAG